MTWKRLATFALGGALVAVGVLIPPAGAAAVPAGTLLIGLATRWPGDRPKKKTPPETPAAETEGG